ncbi:choline transporter-like protein 2 [Babylonia areolata]|uniref:choline transporter-like protein 2 n=1 Tax=Babylonia areolata TaxID=304850 RepID=UPI003FD0560D
MGSSEEKYGEPREYDPDFKGPVKDRSCTDIICCILFILCILGAAVCSVIGYARGDPQRLVYPTDSAGRFCGQGQFKDKPYLLFFDVLQCARMGPSVILGCPTPQVCVSQCPKENFVYLESELMETGGEREKAREKLICKMGVDPVASKETITDLVKTEKCAAYYVSSKSVINRCVPSVFNKIFNMGEELKTATNQTIVNVFGEKITGSKLENGTNYLAEFYRLKGSAEVIFNDLSESWPHILIGLLLAMLVSLLWIVLLRFLVGVMVWLTLVLFAGLFVFSSYYSYSRYYELKSQNITEEFGLSQAFVLNFEYYLTLKQTWLAFGCTSATLLLLFLLVVIVLAKRICIAIELIKEGSKAIIKMMAVLFWPLFPFFLQLAVVAYWVTSALYIGSMGEKEYYRGNYSDIKDVITEGNVKALLNRIPCDPDNSTLGELCEFVRFGGSQYTVAMQVYMLFMFFWLMNFVVALGQMTLAGAFASYYWAFDKDNDIPSLPLLSSLGRCFRYHLGSLAFGSLLIALVQLVRSFLEYLDRKLKSSENKVAKFILKCLKCCFWCLEKILKFINKNAYIMIAIYGRSFCTATKDAFLLIMRNVLRTFVLDKVSDFIMFISKLMVTGAVAVASYYWFERRIPVLEDYVPDLHYRLVPVIILVLGTYMVTSCFFNVYDMAVDTLFLCFLEDLERNDGSPDKPYYMSKGLQKLLRKGNKRS